MTHTAIQAISATVKGYCSMHGTDSRQCGAAKHAGGLAILAVGAVGIVAALSHDQ